MTEQSASVKLQLQPFDLSKVEEVGSTSFFVGDFGYFLQQSPKFTALLSFRSNVVCQIKKVLLEAGP